MPPFGPIKRRDLIRILTMLGFEGPLSGGKHQFMVRGTLRPTARQTDAQTSCVNGLHRRDACAAGIPTSVIWFPTFDVRLPTSAL
jgi:hypothetical protein